jgi:hypothetical protein
VQVAARFIGESLKELASQAEPESAGHILISLGVCYRSVGEVI